MLKLNILHLMVAAGALGAVAVLRREAAGRSLSFGRLFAAPLLAFAAAFLLLAMSDPEARQPALWVGGLAAGLVAGTARGIMAPLQVDRLWDRLRLPSGRDGLWAASLLGAVALAAFSVDLIPANLPWGDLLEVAASTAAAACAGFLAGRACSLWLRAWNAPHSSLSRP
jgi:hypothetical protein